MTLIRWPRFISRWFKHQQNSVNGRSQGFCPLCCAANIGNDAAFSARLAVAGWHNSSCDQAYIGKALENSKVGSTLDKDYRGRVATNEVYFSHHNSSMNDGFQQVPSGHVNAAWRLP